VYVMKVHDCATTTTTTTDGDEVETLLMTVGHRLVLSLKYREGVYADVAQGCVLFFLIIKKYQTLNLNFVKNKNKNQE